MVYFLTVRGGPLSHFELWSKSHIHPYDATLSSQRISEILKTIETDQQQTFFKNWALKIAEKDYLCYDITSGLRPRFL